jgi:hypothetical protein
MGAAVPASLRESDLDSRLDSQVEPPPATEILTPSAQDDAAPVVSAVIEALPIEGLKTAVLQAIGENNQRILASMLEAGEWSVQANELLIKVAESQTVVDMSLAADARRLVIASASGVLGRAVKLRIIPGATVMPQPGRTNGSALRGGGSSADAGGRTRAEQDVVVRRLREKFGAEIRTVIDYKEKR